MKVKTCPARIKAAEIDEEGVFEAIVAAYNVDSVGDRIVPGAFRKTLDAWHESGDPIPVLWAHKSDDPEYHIGHVIEAEERPEGLWVKARIDIDEPGSKSAKVYRLLKGRRVRQFSFAYDEIDARPAQEDGSGAQKELHELRLHEVGPCLLGANQETALLGVKTDPPAAEPPPDAIAAHVAEQDAALGAALTVKAAERPLDTKTSGIVAALAEGRPLLKEDHEALTSLLVDLAAGMEKVAAIVDAHTQQATPAQPVDPPRPSAEGQASGPVDEVRPGTASVIPVDDLMRLALLEAEAEVDTY